MCTDTLLGDILLKSFSLLFHSNKYIYTHTIQEHEEEHSKLIELYLIVSLMIFQL